MRRHSFACACCFIGVRPYISGAVDLSQRSFTARRVEPVREVPVWFGVRSEWQEAGGERVRNVTGDVVLMTENCEVVGQTNTRGTIGVADHRFDECLRCGMLVEVRVERGDGSTN